MTTYFADFVNIYNMELKFKLWVEHSRTGAGKVSLYPPLYTQYMNYPPQDILTWSADAITYMDPEDVALSGKAYEGKFRPYIWKGIYRGRTTSD
jgi:hypothetical protein